MLKQGKKAAKLRPAEKFKAAANQNKSVAIAVLPFDCMSLVVALK